MDNFHVPKKINRNVLKALGILQAEHSLSVFVPASSIVKQVEFQMRRGKKVENIEECVLKSLCSLTYLGVLVRTGHSDYALRQALVFEDGTSAIPWLGTVRGLGSVGTKVAKKKPAASKPKPSALLTRPGCRQAVLMSKPCRVCLKRMPARSSGQESMEAEPIDKEFAVLRSDSTDAPHDDDGDFDSETLAYDLHWDFENP
ncbi:hypothetical protein AWZ03_015046, partial [Drosophila navojoa]